MGLSTSPTRALILAATAVLVAFAAWNALDVPRQPHSGFMASNNVLTEVRPGEPADRAGLQVGDRLVRDGGIDVADTKAIMRRGRPAIGEVRAYEFERAGERHTATLTFEAPPARIRLMMYGYLLIGLCMIGFGIAPFMARPGAAEKLLAASMLCLAPSLVGWPYVSALPVRTALNAIGVTVVLLGLALLLHFVLVFPVRSPWVARRGARSLLYAPVAALGLAAAFLLVVQPPFTSSVRTVMRIFAGLVTAGYIGAIPIVLLRRYLGLAPQQRSQLGLNLVLGMIAVAVLPSVLQLLLMVAAPRVVLPAADFWGFTLVLLPVGLWAGVRKARQQPAESKTEVMQHA